jgi:hypothetical protein
MPALGRGSRDFERLLDSLESDDPVGAEEVTAGDDATTVAAGNIGGIGAETVDDGATESDEEVASGNEADNGAIADANAGVQKTYETEQARMAQAADGARQEESFQSFFNNDQNVAPKDKFQYIMIVARGLVDGVPADILDLKDLEPFKSAAEARALPVTKLHLKLTGRLCAKEVKRRNPHRLLNIKNKKMTEFLEMLTQEMPIQSAEDIAFITNKFNSNKTAMENSLAEYNSRQTEISQRIAPTDYYRWICMLEDTDDDTIKRAYLKKDDSLTRSELDARKSQDHHVQTLHELAVHKFNDPNWIPFTRAIPSLHSTFKHPIQCLKREEYDLTVEKSKSILQTMKTHVSRLMAAYNKSGNGSDQLAEDGEGVDFNKIGHFDAQLAKANSQEGDNLIDGDDRQSFLSKAGGSVPALYWWDTLDTHKLLHCTQGTLKGSCAADGVAASNTAYGSRPRGSGRKKRKHHDDELHFGDDDNGTAAGHPHPAESLSNLGMIHQDMVRASESNAIGRDEQALCGINKTLQAMKNNVFQLEEHLEDETNSEGRVARLQSRLEEAREDLKEQQERYNKLKKNIDERREALVIERRELYEEEV